MSPKYEEATEGKTRVTVLLEFGHASRKRKIVTGFGAFTNNARAVALIGWKANRQAFACVEAVGTDEELNCCLKRLTA